MTEVERKKCNRCKVNMTFDKFKKKRDDSYQKLCIECNSKCVIYNNENKCKHNLQKARCRDCGGSQFCEHSIQKTQCRKCSNNQFCYHNRLKSTCKDCGGSQICGHNRIRSTCKDCGGGSFCAHNRKRSTCKDCGGGSVCEHKRQKTACKVCDFSSYLTKIVRRRILHSLKSDKKLSSEEYIGCDIETFKVHIEKTFEEGMNWDNYGEWHIDHIIPIKYIEDDKVADLEEVVKRLHYTNTQALWASDNMAKGNRFIGK